MKTVWKFGFPVDDRFRVSMPAGARILSVQAQRECPCLWALVDSSAEPEVRTFRLAGTGHPVDDGLTYLGSFQMAGGRLVWHLFEEAP